MNPTGHRLTPDELERYARQIALPEVGPEGQRRLRAASVLLIGAGGLGSPAALYLAAAGVGRLALVDPDVVERSNLHRQVLHGTRDVGRKKLESARDRLLDLNPHVQIDLHPGPFAEGNASALVAAHDVVIDGTDNFPTRYLSSDACVLHRKPNVYGSILRFEGQCTVLAPHLGGPCYRCLFPEPPQPGQVPSCAEGGVLGVLPGVIGTIQAIEAIKLILGAGEPLVGRILHLDALRMRFRELQIRRDPDCPACGRAPTIRQPRAPGATACGCPAGASAPTSIPTMRVERLKEMLDCGERIVILDVRETVEYATCHIADSRHIPLGQLPQRCSELDRDAPIALVCRSGARSARAVEILHRAGFRDVASVDGGILAWASRIDPSMPAH